MNVIQIIYDSEINFSISCFWDRGFDVKLGDPMNKYTMEDNFYSYAEVLSWLVEKVKEFYPHSEAAKKFEKF